MKHSEAISYINAGGRGSRLREVFPYDPERGIAKALLELGNPPLRLVDHHIANSRDQGIQIDEGKIMVTKDDFDSALAEIKPRFGLDDSISNQTSRYGIMMYSKEFTELYDQIKLDLSNFMSSKNEQMLV